MTKAALHHGFSFVAGFMVRPCCVIPAALAVLGLSGAGIAAAIVPYRSWFLLMAVAFFSVSFYWNFIRNHNRPGMVVWSLSVLLAGAILMGPELRAALNPEPQPKEQTLMTTTHDLVQQNVPVQGMACDACARRLQRVLENTPGIADASVSFKSKQAQVMYDPQRVNPATIAQRIGGAGFKADVEESTADSN